MKFGVSLPPFQEYAAIRFRVESAKAAENVGCPGFFIWDQVFFAPNFYPNVDPWVAIALNTTRLRIDTLITLIARRRLWMLAGQIASIDRPSIGRDRK